LCLWSAVVATVPAVIVRVAKNIYETLNPLTAAAAALVRPFEENEKRENYISFVVYQQWQKAL
jgi:hypothetical protein